MKTQARLAIATVVLCGMAFAGLSFARADGPATAPAAPVNKLCPVTKEPVDVKTGGTVVYKGQLIGFCCPDCLETFNKDPEKYVKGMK